MKKTSILILFSLLCYTIVAQSTIHLDAAKYRYQAGDSIYKYQVDYKDPGSIGRELNWDFSNVHINNDHYLIKYFFPNKKDTTIICGMEHRTRYYYQQRNDSILSTGFENNTTMMNYITPELKIKFPFTYGDTLYSTFEGEGIYSNMLPLKVKGFTRVQADAEGELKLPDGITVPNALRTHTTRHYTQTGKDSVQMTLDTYTWYAKNVRYPVFESVKTTLHNKTNRSASSLPVERVPEGGERSGGEVGEGSGSDDKCPTPTRSRREVRSEGEPSDTTVFYTSFYYTPEELEQQHTSLIPNDSTDIYGNPIPEAERIFTEARMNPNPVISDLIIDYKLTRQAQIWFTVHNNIGIPMRQTSPQTLNEGYHQNQIPMSGLIQGTYTVFVHVDDMIIKRVVVKK